jgi:hypothetical protein
MSILFGILLILFGAGMVVWSMNVSFAAHLQKKNKDLWYYHFQSYALMLMAVVAIVYAARMLN